MNMEGTIIILMSTYNGARFITEQIESIKRQTINNWKLYVWDDGSRDNTLEILKKYEENGVLKIVSNERVGYPNGFYNLMNLRIEGDYYAFCDQDDIWMPNKLEVAKKAIENKNGPALYCSKKYIVDKSLNIIGDDVEVEKGIYNAMLKSNKASGCTMLFNKQLYDILIKYRPQSNLAPYHDSWCYKIAVIFGEVIYDSIPRMLYRQHSANTVGAYKNGWELFFKRVVSFDFTLKRYRYNYGTTNYAKEIINAYEREMPRECLEILNDISNIRESFMSRIRVFICSSISKKPMYEYVIVKMLIILGWM